MKSKEERQADFERREKERKAKYAQRSAEIKSTSESQRAEREEFKQRVAAQKAHEGYSPSFGWIVCGVLFPPLGLYQIWRLLSEQSKATKIARQDLAVRIQSAREQQQGNG